MRKPDMRLYMVVANIYKRDWTAKGPYRKRALAIARHQRIRAETRRRLAEDKPYWYGRRPDEKMETVKRMLTPGTVTLL